MEARFGSPSQIATGPAACGLSTTLRIASRTRSATLRPDRAAALRSASSSSLRRYTCVFFIYGHFNVTSDVRQAADSGTAVAGAEATIELGKRLAPTSQAVVDAAFR